MYHNSKCRIGQVHRRTPIGCLHFPASTASARTGQPRTTPQHPLHRNWGKICPPPPGRVGAGQRPRRGGIGDGTCPRRLGGDCGLRRGRRRRRQRRWWCGRVLRWMASVWWRISASWACRAWPWRWDRGNWGKNSMDGCVFFGGWDETDGIIKRKRDTEGDKTGGGSMDSRTQLSIK